MESFPELEKYLNSFGKKVVDRAVNNLAAAGKGSGRLGKSVRFKVIHTGDGKYDVDFIMENYAPFVDKGVEGSGGEIKTGDRKGTYSGMRSFTTWSGNTIQSPFKFGSGKSKGSIYNGIDKFVKAKGLKPKAGGTIDGLKIAIVKVLWIKGIEGISFFQEPLGLYYNNMQKDVLDKLKLDIQSYITTYYRPD